MKAFGFWRISLIYLLANISHQTGDVKGISSRCDAGTVCIGRPVNVTCFFSTDIVKNPHNFNIERVSNTEENGPQKEKVLSCNVIQYPVGLPNCQKFMDFDYDINGGNVTVEFRKATEDIEGQYTCSISQLEEGQVQSCNLTVKGSRRRRRSVDCGSSIQDENTLQDCDSGDAKNMDCETSSDDSKTTPQPDHCNCPQAGESRGQSANIALGVLFGIQTIAVCMLVAYVILLRRTIRKKDHGSDTGEREGVQLQREGVQLSPQQDS